MRSQNLIFLKDLFVIGLTAFGGPQAHIPVLQNILVKKRNYLSNDELLEIYSLCQFLPGPSSTQTVVGIALKRGGTLLAALALLCWILPAAILMSLLAVLFYGFQRYADFPTELFRFVQPVAIGVVAAGGYDMAQRMTNNRLHVTLIVFAMLITAFISSPWIFPIILLLGCVATILWDHSAQAVSNTQHQPLKWLQSSVSLLLFIALFIASAITGALSGFKPIVLFENFYRFGSITFGGGYVLAPMMFEQFVHHRNYLTSEEFLTGYAIGQALPGPSFAFASFAGGMALHALGYNYTLLGCLLGTVAIFLPGFLIMLGVFPYWEFIKDYAPIQKAMNGLRAIAAGIVLGASISLSLNLEWSVLHPAIILITFLFIRFTPLKVTHLIVGAIFLGAVVMQLN